jgi:hypothetical protein
MTENTDAGGPGWYSVRCVFKDDANGVFEERITLWRASGFDEALALAEEEAEEYAQVFDSVRYLGLAQASQMWEEPGHGAEIFSLTRESSLGDEEYLDTFFSTGQEREQKDPS